MGLQDVILGPIYLLITFFIAVRLKKRLAKTKVEQSLYFKIFFFKAFAVTFFALIYEFYYGGGDTMGFFGWSKSAVLFFVDSPFKCLSFLFTDSVELFYFFKYNYYAPGYGYLLKYGSRELTFIKLITPLNILALGSYLGLSYLFSLLIFVSNWLLYKVFADNYPQFSKGLIYSVTAIPSVAFWGTGILKDSIVFAGICLVVCAIHKIFFKQKNLVLNGILLLASMWIIFSLRSFAILSLLPAAMLWLFLTYNSKIKQKVLRRVLTPLVLVFSSVAVVGLLASIGDSLGRFSFENLDQTITDFQGWHKVASDGGSGYTLTVDNSSFLSMLKSFPAAINVTFFRPYLWEASGIVVLFSALESFAILLFFLYAFFIKAKVVKFISLLFSEPLLMLCLVFAMLYGFSVGFTSFNFGALSRYKVPAMPFFVTLLYLIYGLSSRKKT